MTRVLQVMGRSAGGIARHVAQVTAALDGTDGLTIDIACPADLPLAMPKQAIRVEIPDGPAGGHGRVVKQLRRLSANYDVVHAHGLRAGIDAGMAARNGRARSLVTVHNLVRAEISGELRAALYRRAEAVAVRLNDHTFAVSQDIARHLRRSIAARAESIEVLYLGIGDAPVVERDPVEVRAELGLAPEAPLVVSVARLAPQKSLGVLLRAIDRLDGNVSLAIVGEGPLRSDLERDVGDLSLGRRVHLLGFRRDVADWIAAADVFALSSIWEGVPLAAQEAILLGTPIVATDVGGMRELIANKVSGRLCPPGDPEAIAAALEEVLTDRERAVTYATAAAASLRTRFSTEAMLRRLREAYGA
ncbi:MAG TPA: glycosyltransferase family 4 protein [Actinomycetota bacterium]|nr:glycosyltransferase family 4 protein [Actinomycetota bacterium]